MADKIKKSGSAHDDDERYSRRHDEEEDDDDFDGGGYNNNRRNNDGGSKYEKLYGVIDAFIDQIDMPRNRNRAVKFGIRALGELLSESNSGRGGNRGGGRSQNGGSSDSGERGVSRSSKK